MISQGVKYILMSTVFFAVMNTCVKYLQHIPSVQIVWFRSLVTLVICLYFIWRRQLKPFGNNKPLLLARGLMGACALLCYFYSLQHMPMASAVTIQYLAPVFTVILAMIILKERVTVANWLVLAVCLIGVGLIKGYDPRIETYTLIVGLSAAVFSGLAYNIVRKLRSTDEPLIIVFYFPLVTFPIVTPVMWSKWVNPSFSDLALLLLVGIFTQLGQIHLTKAYMTETASKIAGLSYTGLILAIAIGYFFFNESLNMMSVMGIMLIIGSVIVQVFMDYESQKPSKAHEKQKA